MFEVDVAGLTHQKIKCCQEGFLTAHKMAFCRRIGFYKIWQSGVRTMNKYSIPG